jgi:hypothetical protein
MALRFVAQNNNALTLQASRLKVKNFLHFALFDPSGLLAGCFL